MDHRASWSFPPLSCPGDESFYSELRVGSLLFKNSDIDFLIELAEDASALGVGGFQYETEQLLGVEIDVIPTFALSQLQDKDFVRAVETEAVDL